MNSENIYTPNTEGPYPLSLTSNDHWSLMRLVWSEKKKKFLKIPIDIRTGLTANSEEMNAPFPVAAQHLTDNTVLNYFHPVGSTMRLGLIDCDNCIAPDGSISPLIRGLLLFMDTYAEYSVSNGIHVLCWLDAVPPGSNKDREWDVEFYWQPRSIPITGNRVELANWKSPPDLQPRTKQFLSLHKSRFAEAWLPSEPPSEESSVLSREEVISKLFREPQGRKWADIYAGNWHEYYESPSDADLALLIKFAFYTGKDRHLMDAMFSECPLADILRRGTVEKPTVWRTRKWANQNYRKLSLDAAIAKTTSVYTPHPKPISSEELYRLRRKQIHGQK